MKIQTVTGSIDKNQIGKCLIHQHVLFGYPGWECTSTVFDYEDALNKSVKILKEAKEKFGLATVVDATPGDCGRNAVFLKEVSEASGVNIIASTGYYYEGEGAPAYFKFRMAYGNAQEEIYKMMKKEITEGIGNTGIRAGIIKVGTSAEEITEYEDLFLRAAAKVSLETGVRIITHTQGGKQGSEQARRLISYGAPAEQIMIGHLDNCTDIDELMQIFETGVYGGFDRLGIQGFTGALPESRRLAAIAGLAASGFGNKIMLAHDSIVVMLGDPWIYSEQDAKDLTNWNWTHAFEHITPKLKDMGVAPQIADAMTETTPAEFLAGK